MVGESKRRGRRRAAAVPVGIKGEPFETAELRKLVKQFFSIGVSFYKQYQKPARLGSFKYGVYAFYDYDGEPMYVGQTAEGLSSRISRHLTGQRSDAVAMSVLDPFEVYEVEAWPLPQYQKVNSDHPQAKEVRRRLDALEATVYRRLVRQSRFKAVLNEKPIVSSESAKVPKSYRGVVVSADVYRLRAHVDMRIARRAQTLARLAQVISERAPSKGLRVVLCAQARRLAWLAERRLKSVQRGKATVNKSRESDE